MSDTDTQPGDTAEGVLDYIVRQIVSQPDEVSIDTDLDDDLVRFDVTVGDGDVGRVIGRRGRTAQAIRAVVRAAADADDLDAEVEFLD